MSWIRPLIIFLLKCVQPMYIYDFHTTFYDRIKILILKKKKKGILQRNKIPQSQYVTLCNLIYGQNLNPRIVIFEPRILNILEFQRGASKAALAGGAGLRWRNPRACYHLLFSCSFGFSLLIFFGRTFASVLMRDVGPEFSLLIMSLNAAGLRK